MRSSPSLLSIQQCCLALLVCGCHQVVVYLRHKVVQRTALHTEVVDEVVAVLDELSAVLPTQPLHLGVWLVRAKNTLDLAYYAPLLGLFPEHQVLLLLGESEVEPRMTGIRVYGERHIVHGLALLLDSRKLAAGV